MHEAYYAPSQPEHDADRETDGEAANPWTRARTPGASAGRQEDGSEPLRSLFFAFIVIHERFRNPS